MRWYEKLGSHLLLFGVFAAICLNVLLICKLRVSWWSLPLAYALYCVAWLIWQKRWPTKAQLTITILAPLAFLLAAQCFGMVYDTSWDGQDYQQSGVIALHQGWNPWYSDQLPMQLPQSINYIVGYPKTTWLLQDSIYELTGRLQTAKVINLFAALAAGLLAYGACVRLGLRRRWALLLTTLAVTEIHALQQLFTFLEDGYSYELALAALAAGALVIRQRKSLFLMVFLAAWLLLAGGKFSNLFICALLGAVCVFYLVRIKAYTLRHVWYIAGLFAASAVVLLWVPFGVNALRHGSPIYPQNQSGAATKLLQDNLPTNLRTASRPVLVWYGIFSHLQRSDAGDPASPNNIARLKLPFTFEPYELEQLNNFQGRVGSGGLFFSGCVVIAASLYTVLLFRKKTLRERKLLLGITILGGCIILAALVIPVPNKLRYSPLITLIPLLVVLALTQVNATARWLKLGTGILAACVIANTLSAMVIFASARSHETQVITAQLTAMQRSGHTYEVEAHNLYSSYTRLAEYHIPFSIARPVSCKQPATLEYTNWTTAFCVHTK